MAYTRINLQHILIKSGTSNVLPLAKIKKIHDEITHGMSFEKAVIAYSEDEKSKDKQGHLGWISTGKITSEISQVAYSLPLNTLSAPIKSPVGYHLIRVLDRATLIPPTLNATQLKETVRKDKQRRISQEYVATFMKTHPLLVTDPLLKAYNAKISGDIATAIGAYQSQVSSIPTSPAPHYLLAKLYLQTNQRSLAIQELKKAALKAQLNKGSDFISLHLLLGKLYKEDGDNAKKQEQYRLAILAAGSHGPSLIALSQQFKKLGETTLENEVSARIPKDTKSNPH